MNTPDANKDYSKASAKEVYISKNMHDNDI